MHHGLQWSCSTQRVTYWMIGIHCERGTNSTLKVTNDLAVYFNTNGKQGAQICMHEKFNKGDLHLFTHYWRKEDRVAGTYVDRNEDLYTRWLSSTLIATTSKALWNFQIIDLTSVELSLSNEQSITRSHWQDNKIRGQKLIRCLSGNS